MPFYPLNRRIIYNKIKNSLKLFGINIINNEYPYECCKNKKSRKRIPF
jgi:hypothetical protein